MILQLDLETHMALDDMRAFLAGTPNGATLAPSREQTYAHLERVLRRYLECITGLSSAQLTRLIRRYRQKCGLSDRRGGPGRSFPTKYTEVAMIS